MPPVQYIIDNFRNRLAQSASVQVLPFSPVDHEEAWRIIAANYFEDGGADICEICQNGNEALLPPTNWILQQCQVNMSAVAATHQGRKTARDTFRQAYSAHWERAGVDVVLAPVTPSTAPPLGATPYWGYTAIWNLLQYPAIALPASKFVSNWSTVILSAESYTPKTEQEKTLFQQYSMTPTQGMPVGVQVVAKRLHENLLVQAARVIEEALR
jgi:Asp-tRNA(Asn)/Glu-tRNA(Gln) amidotransferase A subunit family amidase